MNQWKTWSEGSGHVNTFLSELVEHMPIVILVRGLWLTLGNGSSKQPTAHAGEASIKSRRAMGV